MKKRLLLKEVKDFWEGYKRNRAAVGGLAFIILLALLGLTAPIISPYDPFEHHYEDIFKPPNLKGYLFGTDHLGRDLFSRVLWGIRVTLLVGIGAAGIGVVIGICLGAIAGYYGGAIDEVISRFVDIMFSIPTLFLAILVIAMFGGSTLNLILVIGLTLWPGTTRLVRAEFLTFKEREFVEASRICGASDKYIIFHEILPNAMYPAIINASLLISAVILMEAALSFLGLGDPNVVSWGWILHDGIRYFRVGWWIIVLPGILISLTVLSFNLMSDGLNDTLNPHLRER